MWKRRFQNFVLRVIALCMVASMLTTDAEAVVKAVYVWGVRSINDKGYSDVRVSMEDVEEDYSGYFNTAGLTEYFHKDVLPLPKTNMTEALGWLIDNGIISRDSTVTVTDLAGLPSVSISKEDLSTKLYGDVTRSDALMYIYKCVFGPLTGRVIGAETQCVRTESGVEKILLDMMVEHGYLEEMEKTGHGEIIQEPGVSAAGNGVEIWAPHIDIGGSAVSGAGAYNGIIDYIDTSTWRYSPQGDKVISIFGDTNLFISDVQIIQDINTGYVKTGDHGSGGIATGDGQIALDYDTDYKEIFYVPGADLWFYRTTDIVEMYLQSLESKGIIEFEASLRSDDYKKCFEQYTKDGNLLASWSGQADPYIVNLLASEHNRAENVAYAPMEEVLGKNYTVNFNGSALTVKRKPIFESSTGYFTTEFVTRMDVYHYIYSMVSANEKKLTTLESDIVNYKYGLQFGDGLPGDDLDVIKFLVAKGILNYDGSDELTGLYAAIKWADLIPILYRVANPDARLDFSKIQLTDSEQAWKAKGFQPSSVDIVPSGAVSEIEMVYSNEYLDSLTPDIEDEAESTGSSAGTLSLVMWSEQSLGSELLNRVKSLLRGDGWNAPAVDPRNAVQREYGAPNLLVDRTYTYDDDFSVGFNPFLVTVSADDTEPAQIVYNEKAGLATVNSRVFFDYTGFLHAENGGDLEDFKSALQELKKQQKYVYSSLDQHYTSTNPKLRILVEYLQNIHYIAYLQDGGDIGALQTAINEWLEECKEDELIKKGTANPGSGWDVGWLAALTTFAGNMLECINDITGNNNLHVRVVENVRYCMGNQKIANPMVVGLSNIMNNLRVIDPVYGTTYTLEFDYTTTNGTTVHKTQSLGDVRSEAAATGSKEDYVKFLNTCTYKSTESVSYEQLASSSEKELLEQAGARVGVLDADGGLGFDSDSSYFSSESLNLYVDPTSLKDGYVKWSDIESASKGTIIQKSETILYNKSTQTYAYFKYDNDNPAKSRALVGDIVVHGDSKYGVIQKVEENGVTEVYYHLGAVRQLMSLSDDQACFGGRNCVAQSDQAVIDNTKMFPVTNSTGTQSSQVSAIRAVVHKDATTGAANNSNSKMWKAGTTVDNYRYCNFVALAQSNRIANIIYRKFTYTVASATEESGTGVAYGVLVFRAADIAKTGSPGVSSGTSMQDLLDSPGLAPSGDQTVWNANMKVCNDYANWIYGTQEADYVNTGYLEPEVYLFVIGDKSVKAPPNSLFGSLSDVEVKAIHVCSLGIMENGLTMPRDTTEGNKNPCTYYVDSDFHAMVSGDRLFLNEAMFDNVKFEKIRGQSAYVLTNSESVVSPFSVGTVFAFFESADGREYGNPTARVTAVSKDGIVTAQIGPFIGMPVRYNGNNMMVSENVANSSGTIGTAKFTNYMEGGLSKTGLDLWQQFYYDTAKLGLNIDWTDGKTGKLCVPVIITSNDNDSTHLVFDGAQLKLFEGSKTTNCSIPVGVSAATTTFTDARDTLVRLVNSNQSIVQKTAVANKVTKSEAYYEIKFSAWHYSVRNGALVHVSNVGADSFLSPALFTNLNDVLIDKVIDESTGAIPVNEIPAGSLLKIGDYFYEATGTSTDDKSFVGYAPLFEYVSKPQIVHVAKAWATQMIYAGNQYINVSHWMDPMPELLSRGDYASELSNVARKALTGDERRKFAVDGNGTIYSIETGTDTTDDTAATFTPVKIVFVPGLLAYKQSPIEDIQSLGTTTATNESASLEEESSGTDTYMLCNHAESAMSGALDKIPFLADDVLNPSLYTITTDIMSAGFTLNENAPGLRDAIQREFQKAFAGDLFTLLRLVVFLILIWLLVAAWMCYFMWLGNLIPILEAIRYPSGDRGKKGIDLMKIVSLGTISLDTEFRLGRFFQYTVVLAILMWVVGATGSFTFG